MAETPLYRGRFAPSPTGPLHAGSLLAAVASYLDAKANSGQWLLRIEDIDPPREVPGASADILRTLECHGLRWDGDVLYQSSRVDAYAQALQQLSDSGLVFHCTCSRATLGPGGSCGERCTPRANARCSVRLRLDKAIVFHDRFAGPQDNAHPDSRPPQDVVLRRKDGLYAYALAVVVDDIRQGITHVVRGRDLLEQTLVQIQLYRALGAVTPTFGHIPVLCGRDGSKLSKQTGAVALNTATPIANLRQALRYLGQALPHEDHQTPEALLATAVSLWNPKAIEPGREAAVYPGRTNS